MSKFARGLKLIGGNLKNIWKGNKTGKGLIIITALLMVGGCSGEESSTPEQYDRIVSGYEQQIEDLEKELDRKQSTIKGLREDLDELKKEEEERRKAEEESARKAEEERKAQEEAERKAAEAP